MNKDIYNEILDFWFGYSSDSYKEYKEYWVDKSIDHIIKDKYENILNSHEENIENIENIENYKKISLVILFDQFSRSIYRNDILKIKNNDKIAFEISKSIFDNKEDLEYPLEQRIFLLMPFRHAKTSKCLDFVLEKIESYLSDANGDIKYIKLLDRFRNATYMSYTNMTDSIKLSLILSDVDDILKDNILKDDILDDKCKIYNGHNDHKNIKDNKMYKQLEYFILENSIDNIGISLSGGVDSMVILFLLSQLKKENKIKEAYAMHIEYSNRKESPLETKYLSYYCSMLDIPLYLRIVDYFNRDSVDRIFYEEETKKIRFNTYSFLSEKHNIKGWCLGHHKGDVYENVLMNILNGRDLLDLGVMNKITYFSKYKVYLYRPLLDYYKEDIYKTSEQFNIPYFKDTTPDWSCRGVIRRKIIPSLEIQWPSVKDKLINISNQSHEWNEVIQNYLFLPIRDSIKFDKNQIEIPLSSIKNMPRVVWLNIFLYIFHSSGKRMISTKNLDYFMETLKRNIYKENKFMFSNNSLGIFKKDIFYIQL